MKLNENRRVILGCLIAGLLGGLAIATSWKLKSDKDFWDVLSAMGTMAAAVIALGIACRDGMRRAKSDHDKAIIVASRVSVKLDEMTSRADYIELFLGGGLQTERSRLAWFQRMQQYLEAPLPEVTIEDLAALGVLSPSCGHQVAMAMATLDLLRHQILESKLIFEVDVISDEALNPMLKRWHDKSTECLEYLAAARKTCKRASRYVNLDHAAPPPRNRPS